MSLLDQFIVGLGLVMRFVDKKNIEYHQTYKDEWLPSLNYIVKLKSFISPFIYHCKCIIFRLSAHFCFVYILFLYLMKREFS